MTKAAATHYCRIIAQQTGRNIAVLRLYSVFGPYEDPTRLVPRLIITGLDGRLPPLVDPLIGRDFIYIDDVYRAFILLASQPGLEPGAIYNLGSGVQITIRQAVEVTRRLLRIEAEPVWGSMPDRTWDTHIWLSNPSKLKQQTGWKVNYSFETGLQATLDWFVHNRPLISFYKDI